MKLRMKRVISLVLVIMLCFAFASEAFAVDTYKLPFNVKGKETGATVTFYVKTDNSSKRYLQFSMSRGSLYVFTNGGSPYTFDKLFASYEVKSWYKDSKGNWVLEQNFDMYCTDKGKLTFQKKNTEYKVSVYMWKPLTIYNSYFKKLKITHYSGAEPKFIMKAYWSTVPSCTAKFTSGCRLK